jgi:hypothetical protein
LDGVRANADTEWPFASAEFTQSAPVPLDAPTTKTFIAT